jgi:hypothetical protein
MEILGVFALTMNDNTAMGVKKILAETVGEAESSTQRIHKLNTRRNATSM